MQVLLLLALIVTCYCAGRRIHRQVQDQQKFVRNAVYPPRRVFNNPVYADHSFKARSRVFRNVQVQADEPRLFRASGRFQKRVVAAAPTHEVTVVSLTTPSLDTAQINAFNYDEDNHHVNKMNEDNKVMEEAAEYAKGLERTTMAVRGEEELNVTVTPIPISKNVPAIITPLSLPEEPKQQAKQPSPALPQQPPIARPQQDIFTNTVSVQQNTLMSSSNALQNLQNIYQPPILGQTGIGAIQPFTLQPTLNPTPPVFPGIVAPPIASHIASGIPTTSGSASLSTVPIVNPAVPQLGTMQQLHPTIQFPQSQIPPLPSGNFAAQTPPQPSVALQPQPPLTGQIPPPQVAPLGLPTQVASPPPMLPQGVEVINGQSANSSLEQLGCGFDWLTNSCKDVFAIGWCGQCHDFGNIFVHDCKCVRPLIALPPRQQPPPTHVFFSMI